VVAWACQSIIWCFAASERCNATCKVGVAGASQVFVCGGSTLLTKKPDTYTVEGLRFL